MDASSNHSGDTEVLDDNTEEAIASTVNTPEFSSDFGKLIPVNGSACEAFEELLDLKRDDPSWAPHERQFIHEERHGGGPGCFRFNLLLLPRTFATGWVLGAGRRDQPNSGVDIKLTNDAVRDRIGGRHAQLFFHDPNAVLMLSPGPDKEVILNGHMIRDHARRVLPPEACGIVVGNLAFRFEFNADPLARQAYERHMKALMQARARKESSKSVPESLDLTPSPNHFILGRYQLQTPRKAGTFGVVCACIERNSGTIYAAKRLQRRPQTMSSVRSELDNLEKLGTHPHITTIVETIFSDGDKYILGPGRYYNDVWIILKPWAPLSLATVLGEKPHPIDSLGSGVMMKIGHQALQGLDYVHGKGIIHCDVKPENILLRTRPRSLSDVEVILSDFGSSTQSKKEQNHMKGTIAYLGPEIMVHKGLCRSEELDPGECFWSDKSDIWSLGLVFLQMVHRFPADAFTTCVNETRYGVFVIVLRKSRRWIDGIVERMMAWEPKQRPNTDELLREEWNFTRTVVPSLFVV